MKKYFYIIFDFIWRTFIYSVFLTAMLAFVSLFKLWPECGLVLLFSGFCLTVIYEFSKRKEK